MLGPKERFSNRVEDYIRYRPSYPPEVITLLRNECALGPNWTIADIGAGPGNLARLFLTNGNRVLAVEPNQEMREAGENLLAGEAGYTSIAGSAEETGLPDNSVEMITAGQAFHWFDQAPARLEFERILKPGGWLVLVWNTRKADASSFARRYDEMLQSLPMDQCRKAADDEIEAFYPPGKLTKTILYNEQRLDRQSFIGRVLSSSYIPKEGEEGHEQLIRGLNLLFDAESQDGVVVFPYDTEVYSGRLS